MPPVFLALVLIALPRWTNAACADGEYEDEAGACHAVTACNAAGEFRG